VGLSGRMTVDIVDICAWLGICILMDCKRLLIIRHYKHRLEELMHYMLISRVMTLASWEQILRCFHLVNNEEVVQDSKHPQFDRVAKTRWLIDHFIEVSHYIYNLQREITVDEGFGDFVGN
jgi:hypothetical protein